MAEREQLQMVEPSQIVIIGLDVEATEDHPLYDERATLPLNESLVKNIMVYGVLKPVLCRQEAGKYYVVDGRQRVKSAREACRRQDAAGEYTVKVPVRVVKQEDRVVRGIIISGNMSEGSSLLENARKAARMLQFGDDIDSVAINFGKSTQTIRNWLLLIEAVPELQQAVENGHMSASAAIELARKTRDDQKAAMQVLSARVAKRLGSQTVINATDAETDEAEDKNENENETGEDTEMASASESEPAPEPTKPVKVDRRRKPERVTQADALALRRETGQRKEQPGVKRTWLKKALTTKTAKNLTPDQLELLEWVTTGETRKGSWLDSFVWDSEAELAGRKRGRQKGEEQEEDKNETLPTVEVQTDLPVVEVTDSTQPLEKY